jgi:DNA polymerase
MESFFSDTELDQIDRTVKFPNACNQCGLYRKCRSPKMKPTGKGKRKILFVAEAPGEEEDKLNTQLIGTAGKLLRQSLSEVLELNLDDCHKTNAINCRPTKDGSNRKPSPQEIKFCRQYLEEEIRSFEPTVIVLLGESAIQSFLFNRWKKGLGGSDKNSGIVSKWRGWVIPDREYNAWVIPTFHPSYVARMKDAIDGFVVRKIFEDDLYKILEYENVGRPNLLSLEEESKKVQILTEPYEIIAFLKRLLQNENTKYAVSFDYETTGIKPYKEGHDIICASVCLSNEGCKPLQATSFLLHKNLPHVDKIRSLWIKFLQSKTPKMAHNMKYEELWSRVILGTPVNNWFYDSMLGTHVEDNRPGICSLKFQAYVRLGIVDYDSVVESYLKSDEKESHSINRIHKCLGSPSLLHDLMLYNGLDSLFEFQLALQQNNVVDKPSYKLLHKGAVCLSDVEITGINVDIVYANNMYKHLDRRVSKMERDIYESKGGKQWKKRYGAVMNINSFPQLGMVLKHDLNCEVSETATGKPSVNEHTLSHLTNTLARDIRELRKIKKLRDTYLAGYLREENDSRIHPFFNLHIARTFRSSSSNPNFQNIPKRNKEAQKIIRSLFIPNKDQSWMEIDYSGIEVRIAACYHKDPNMIKEITDPKRDMHRDMAKAIYFLDNDEWTKEARYCAKNGFVFPQFYGSYFAQCAQDLWDKIDTMELKTAKNIPMWQHLKKHGIGSYERFELHVKEVERIFWEDRFPTYNRWRDDWYQQYLENGYFDTLTGFRCSGYMKRNDVINYPVQGSAFHCLLWSLHEIKKRIDGWDTRIIGQIHDSICSSTSVETDEFNCYISLARKIMTEEIRDHFKWIIVPLNVEVECSPMNEPWTNQREVCITHPCQTCGCQYLYKDKQTNQTECPLCGEKEDSNE